MILLSIFLLSNTVELKISPTDPTHVYALQSSTNIATGWYQAATFAGNTHPLLVFISPPLNEQYFRIKDLGPIL